MWGPLSMSGLAAGLLRIKVAARYFPPEKLGETAVSMEAMLRQENNITGEKWLVSSTYKKAGGCEVNKAPLKLFCGSANRKLAEEIAEYIRSAIGKG